MALSKGITHGVPMVNDAVVTKLSLDSGSVRLGPLFDTVLRSVDSMWSMLVRQPRLLH